MADAPYRIGIAAVDITPPLGVVLSGYGTRSGVAAEVGHRLRAEAMVVKGEHAVWAFLTSDLAGFPHDSVERIRAMVASGCALAPEAIAIAATHTHSGPAGLACYGEKLTEVDHAWRRETEPALATAIVRAFDTVEPGSFEVAMAEAPLLGSNRRVVAADNTATNEWRDPEGRHTGYFDPSVMVVGVRRPGGRLAAVLVNYGVHPVTLGPESLAISADYPGYMKDAVETAHPGATVLFALAGAANINPRDCIGVGAEWPTRVGTALGRIVNAAVARMEPVAAGPVRSCRVPWTIVSRRSWPEKSDRATGEEITTEVMALRAGDLAFALIPGELFSEYVGRIRQASPLAATVVVSMANDSVGYLPVDDAMPQGGHEVRFRAADMVEKPLLEHVAEALRRVTAR